MKRDIVRDIQTDRGLRGRERKRWSFGKCISLRAPSRNQCQELQAQPGLAPSSDHIHRVSLGSTLTPEQRSRQTPKCRPTYWLLVLEIFCTERLHLAKGCGEDSPGRVNNEESHPIFSPGHSLLGKLQKNFHDELNTSWPGSPALGDLA
ncbi:hypothetical protein ElyMa_004506800 [Elysia marginata]|uniref:Uncharacterized protein n=1 Tax=Elysia marginata TaxID=1093978 RepID=A0AAV4HNJ5_9GAST|nr:hypothetical protein ElyMa_004506800 [Elysia marginata]